MSTLLNGDLLFHLPLLVSLHYRGKHETRNLVFFSHECWRYSKPKQCHFWAWLKRPIFGVHDSQGSAETCDVDSSDSNCCLLYFNANIMCSFTKRFSYWGTSQAPYRGSTPGPCLGTSIPQTPSLLLCPPNNPVRSTTLCYGIIMAVCWQFCGSRCRRVGKDHPWLR